MAEEAGTHQTPGSARAEAERLVVAALAAVQHAASGAQRERLATGSAECCVCPVCRAIAAARDPSPEFAERLAAGAGELAAGVAALLRSFAGPDPRPPGPRPAAEAEDAAGPVDDPDVWAAATHADAVSEDGPGNGEEGRR